MPATRSYKQVVSLLAVFVGLWFGVYLGGPLLATAVLSCGTEPSAVRATDAGAADTGQHREQSSSPYAFPVGPAGGGLYGSYPSPIVPPWSLTNLPTPYVWLRADYGIGYVQGPVIATGTTPPAVTLTGVAGFYVPDTIEIDIETPGTLGVSTFGFKINGAQQAGGVATTATYALGFSGITANFPAGTYAANNVYVSALTVASWADQSGSSHNVIQDAGANQLLYVTDGGRNGGPAVCGIGSQYLQGAWTQSQPEEIYVSGLFTTVGTSGTLVDGYVVNSARLYRNTTTTEWSIYSGGMNGDTVGNLAVWNTFAGLYNGATSGVASNGSPFFAKSIGNSDAGGLTVMAAGNAADTATACIDEVVVFPAPLTLAQRAQVNSYFAARSQVSNTLVFDGNSFLITESSTLPTDVTDAMNSFGPTNINNGQGGETTQVMTSRALTATDPFFGLHRGAGNVVVAVEGTNDIYYGATAASAFADLQAYVNARLSRGWKVVVTTVVNRSLNLTPADFWTTATAYNALVRAAYGPDAGVSNVALADWALDPNMGCQSCNTNLTYFQSDQTHPTVVGCGLLATGPYGVLAAIQSFGFAMLDLPANDNAAHPECVAGPEWCLVPEKKAA